MKLEIGGGTLVAPGWENLDPKHGSRPELRGLVQDGILLPTESVDVVRASHVLEHIPAGEPRLDTFATVWRVLKPGGLFEIIVPCVGYTNFAGSPAPESVPIGMPVHNGWQPWADPTHVSYWWFPESFWYMTGRYAANAEYHGIHPWEVVEERLVDGWEAHVTLKKPA